MRSHTSRDNNVTPLPPAQSKPMDDNLRPDLWDRRYNAREIETLKVVAQQYGLDPLMREVMMLQGNIYVTAAGLQKLAQRDPSYNGCQIEPVVTDWENNFFVMKASVYKKGCDYPFEDFGDADPTTSKLRGRALFRHAITRARARAIRSAFAVPFCALEELDDEMRWKAMQQEAAHEVSKRPREKKKADVRANKQPAQTPSISSEPVETTPASAKKAEAPAVPSAEPASSVSSAQPPQPTQLASSAKPAPSAPAAETAQSVLSTEPAQSAADAGQKRSSSKRTKAPADLATAHQHKMLRRYIQQLGWNEADVQEKVNEAFGTQDVQELTRLQASNLLDLLAEHLKQQTADTPESNLPASSQSRQDAQTQELERESVEEPTLSVAEPVEHTAEVAQPAAEVAQTTPEPAPARVSEPDNTGLKWTGVEQKRIAEDLLQRMKKASSLEDLRREWQMFQGLRHKLGADWIEQICETKDQRKAALSAG